MTRLTDSIEYDILSLHKKTIWISACHIRFNQEKFTLEKMRAMYVKKGVKILPKTHPPQQLIGDDCVTTGAVGDGRTLNGRSMTGRPVGIAESSRK